jgi:hypothetical protein
MSEPLCITKHQQAAKRRFGALIANVAAADAAYNVLPGSCGGKIISTDSVRLLDDRYRNVPVGKLRDLAPSWDGAWRYAQKRLEREIANRGNRRTLRFMAGGWASGKTYALRDVEPADLAWDGTLADERWAAAMVILALEHGWRVQIAYVQRPVVLALWGSLDRAMEEGRTVPLLLLPTVHRAAQQSILKLHSTFGNDPRVAFILIFNAGTRAEPREGRKLSISDIAPDGVIHYTQGDVKSYQQTARKVWQAAGQSGHYPAEILAAAGAGMGKENGK